MSDFVRADRLRAIDENCGTCDHRTAFLGYCVKKGKKIGKLEGPCPMYVRRLSH